MTNPLQELQNLGQSVWFDNIRRGFIKSGELQRLIDLGVSGLTSNPSIFEKAITGSADYDESLLELALSDHSAVDIFENLAIEDIQDAADMLRPVYDRTEGADGFASIEVNPHLAHDTHGTISEAQRLHSSIQRPNVMIKVPATPACIPAIRQLIADGISVNVTLIFSLDAYAQVREAYISGLEDFVRAGGDAAAVSSVASFFVSRVDANIDAQIENLIAEGRSDIEDLMGKAAIANAKIAYSDFKRTFSSDRFAVLQGRGGRVQRPLWASTSTKNPEYSDVLYVDSLIGPNTVNTLPDVTLTAFLEHGNPDSTIETELQDAVHTMEALEDAGISMTQVTDALLTDGVKAFADSFDTLIANIQDKRNKLVARQPSCTANLGSAASAVDAVWAGLQSEDVVRRIWEGDHTVWKDDPTEIADRLGWLTVAAKMRQSVADLQEFADEVRSEGCKQVVLLGMGGSSLGPEALRRLFCKPDAIPNLIVLDSTLPECVQSVSDAINPADTLFIVSSKSGSTIEPNALYKHFRTLVEQAVDAEQNHLVGRHFVAVTDAGSPLERMANEQGFRRIFTNPSNIGGRYSVQSFFGLLPAALAGIDIAALLDSVEHMSNRCAASVPANDNPGAWFGAAMGALADAGRDKLSIITTPSLSGFGLWAEQLLAESTGKEGKGIIPVSGEPMCNPDRCGDDRLFVYVRLHGDNTDRTDAYIARVEACGVPVIRMGLQDKHHIGAEFFRWEFATAVAGSVIGINPFDQPNVQQAKDITSRTVAAYLDSDEAPSLDDVGSFPSILSLAKPGDYLAILAYIPETPQAEEAIAHLRCNVTEKYGIATTLGYGPRYLHSTGQIHKGGPGSGIFLQITQAHSADIPVPREAFSFGVLADAQAKGDLDALAAQGRCVVRLNIGTKGIAAIEKITGEL